ncbi:MAG: hypothetical protein QOI24_1018 [Acidobacteriota bacterium]|nr:hypothetical protein [Acidobacteriota bacterium]
MYALKSNVPRIKIVLLLVFAALFALEPVLHTHPLTFADAGGLASSPAPCAACASQTVRITPPAPALAAPQTVAYTLTACIIGATAVSAPSSTPSRAPPAA